jgi:hypothetical protein
MEQSRRTVLINRSGFSLRHWHGYVIMKSLWANGCNQCLTGMTCATYLLRWFIDSFISHHCTGNTYLVPLICSKKPSIIVKQEQVKQWRQLSSYSLPWEPQILNLILMLCHWRPPESILSVYRRFSLWILQDYMCMAAPHWVDIYMVARLTPLWGWAEFLMRQWLLSAVYPAKDENIHEHNSVWYFGP